jgi:hypothetical protein
MTHNKSFDTDTQVCPRRSAHVVCAGQVQRYASAGSVPTPAKFAVLQAGPALPKP